MSVYIEHDADDDTIILSHESNYGFVCLTLDEARELRDNLNAFIPKESNGQSS